MLHAFESLPLLSFASRQSGRVLSAGVLFVVLSYRAGMYLLVHQVRGERPVDARQYYRSHYQRRPVAASGCERGLVQYVNQGPRLLQNAPAQKYSLGLPPNGG